MKFIIQYNLMNNIILDQISTALADMKIPHEFVGVIPFSHEITSDEPLEGRDYLPYGSTLLTMLTYRDAMNWKGNYFIPETFRAEAWIDNRIDMLNTAYGSIEAVLKLLATKEPESLWFTRPCEDLKQYSGQVMKTSELQAWLKDAMECESSGSYKLSPDTMIQLCQPRNIQAEWRWFIVDGQIVSGSIYRREGQMYKQNETDIATVYEAQQLANIWLPHRNCVMDTALVDGDVRILEFNTINSSGFYDHDVNAIICALWEDFKRDNH